MNDKRDSDPVAQLRKAIRTLTLALPLLLWCMGFLLSLAGGCRPGQAVPKATAYAISGSVGWLIYLFIRRPSRGSFREIFAGLFASSIVCFSFLNPPWTFPEMLADGLIRAAVCMPVIALVHRLIARKWG